MKKICAEWNRKKRQRDSQGTRVHHDKSYTEWKALRNWVEEQIILQVCQTPWEHWFSGPYSASPGTSTHTLSMGPVPAPETPQQCQFPDPSPTAPYGTPALAHCLLHQGWQQVPLPALTAHHVQTPTDGAHQGGHGRLPGTKGADVSCCSLTEILKSCAWRLTGPQSHSSMLNTSKSKDWFFCIKSNIGMPFGLPECRHLCMWPPICYHWDRKDCRKVNLCNFYLFMHIYLHNRQHDLTFR